MEKLKFSGRIEFLDGLSHDLIPTISRRRRFDLILVDGDHSVGAAADDVANVWPLLKVGGLLVLDDTVSCPLGNLPADQAGAELIHVEKRRPGSHTWTKRSRGAAP